MANVREGQAVEPSAGPPAPNAAGKLVFVGFMGAGKSTAARQAAERLGGEALDSDSLLEADLGEPIESFFDRQGEPAFREREEALVLELLKRPAPRVLALGGGAVESARIRERLADHLCVYLEVDPELAWKRAQRPRRPLARERDAFLGLHFRRVPLYESVARVLLPADAPVERALPAILRLSTPGVPTTTRLIWARTDAGGYPVYVGPAAIEVAGALWPADGRCFVIADDRVHALHGERLSAALSGTVPLGGMLTVPSGERHKTLPEAERVLRELARRGMERSDAIAAFGGGVTGDLAGFCAAVYQRGVAHAQLPTTLVAQVDSAYGGKTGVDLPDAKNYVGAFHQPAVVVTDPGLLGTLPPEELRAGFSEVVKTALIAGGRLWENVRALPPLDQALAQPGDPLPAVIEDCIRTKLAIVAHDELELGRRAALNLGHTFAHALEAATGYGAYRHGEAVGLGLLVTLRLSERELGLDPSIRAEVEELLARNRLPSGFRGPSTDELLAYAARDKKRRAGQHKLVLLRAPGDVVTACEVQEQRMRAAIEELCAEERSKR